jgi:predicted ATPase/DNA-binding CsgD family transcriptional regulator
MLSCPHSVFYAARTAYVLQNWFSCGYNSRTGAKDLSEHPMSDTPQQERKNAVGESPMMQEHGRPRDNLPLQLTSFVGREQEISEIEVLLREHRLLTLSGPGGSGKTRLSLAVASRAAQDFGDGVWLVELAPLSDPDLVPQAVASVLGVQETPGTPLVEKLVDYLEPRHVLLVLDNCEHLTEACAFLSETLLRRCPDLRVLATSREVLGIAGETLFDVPPLSLPDPHHLPAVDSLPRYEASRLFVERARTVRPDFTATAGNAMAIAQICYRLDGIPLAIELAAARVRVLSVDQISIRLDDSFRLLTGSGRSVLARQRTLRATMDWSYGLLDEAERALFRRLSVFAGGFTLGAAEPVAAGEGIEEADVLDLLTSLVDKSLVIVDERDAEARYRLLETARQYGWEKLQESGEAERARGRHAQFYVAFAEEPASDTEGQGARLRKLGAEQDNFRAAQRWFMRPNASELDVERGLRLATALGRQRFWAAYALSEGRGWLDRGLANDRTSPELLRARAMYEAGWLATVQGDLQQAVVWLRESLDTFERLGETAEAAISLTILGQLMIQGGDRGLIDPLCKEAEALLGELADRRAESLLLIFLSLAAWDEGDHPRTVELAERSLSLSRELGDLYAIALCAGSLGFAVLGKGETDRAEALFVEGLQALQDLQDKIGVFHCLLGMAGVAGSRGQPARMARLGGAAEALGEVFAISLLPMYRRNFNNEERMVAARTQLGEREWLEAWAEGRAMSPERAIEYALEAPEPPEDTEVSPSYPSGLSAREVEVLRLVAKGLTNAQIAEDLYISPRTVNAHLGSIYHKIGSSTRAEATRFASEHDLL